MKLKNLRVNHIENPLGFQVKPLSFSWIVEENGEAKKQESARIRIYEETKTGSAEVFDSGECSEIDSLDYPVNIELKPRTRYTWSVEVTADNGERAEATSWFNNIYDGEAYDARQKKVPVKDGRILLEAPKNCGELSDRYSLPVKQKERFTVKEVIHTPSGDTVLDFGQNLTGWVEFDCALSMGSKIRLTASEIMQNGEFYHENLRTAKTEFLYISDGKERHVRPHFTFYGFRYMKIEVEQTEESFSDAELKSQFTAVHLRSDFDQIGWIETGDESLGRLSAEAGRSRGRISFCRLAGARS